MTLSALKRAAEQATPGPWTANRNRAGMALIDAEKWYEFAEVCIRCDGKPDKEGEANANFIAACDPQTVLKLIKAVEALQAACVIAYGKACFKTSNGIPMGMPRKTERIVRRALQELGL